MLSKMGLKHDQIALHCDESHQGIANEKVAETLAIRKSKSFGKLKSDQLLITADTTVLLNDRILNKPSSMDEAYAMLVELSGNLHRVISGVCLRTSLKEISFSVESKVQFAELETVEIEHYIQTYQPLDKAGSYGIQEWLGLNKIQSINGCYYNIMGLPCARLYEEIKTSFSNFMPLY